MREWLSPISRKDEKENVISLSILFQKVQGKRESGVLQHFSGVDLLQFGRRELLVCPLYIVNTILQTQYYKHHQFTVTGTRSGTQSPGALCSVLCALLVLLVLLLLPR